jgi:hypothetical protein
MMSFLEGRMKTTSFITSCILCCSVLGGCGLLPPQDPVSAQERTVTPTTTRDKTITLKESMVWYNRPFSATRGIRFPEGVYTLEAEDDEYYYFASPKEIEYRVFQEGKVVDGRSIPGGLFLGKRLFKMVPAGVYMTADEHTRIITWKLGAEFLRMEGKLWTRNY